jgi:hypothetical protein
MDEIQTPGEGEEIQVPVVEEEEYVQVNPVWDNPRCKGVTAAGAPCGSYAKKGTDFCSKHQPPAVVPVEAFIGDKIAGWPRYKRIARDNETVPRHKPYPFHDGGVNENSAIRMVAMVKPGCPMDSNPEILKRDGTSIPNPRYTGEPNCQIAHRINSQGIWDVQYCIAAGHDPYFTIFRKSRTEDEVDAEGYIVGSRQRILKERRLNIEQVSDNPRHSSRMEVPLALARGSILLERFVMEDAEGEFVIDPPCEFRGCSAPWKVDTRYGRYCSERHARLVAADFQKKMLPVGGDPYTEDQAMEEREQILSSLSIGKTG